MDIEIPLPEPEQPGVRSAANEAAPSKKRIKVDPLPEEQRSEARRDLAIAKRGARVGYALKMCRGQRGMYQTALSSTQLSVLCKATGAFVRQSLLDCVISQHQPSRISEFVEPNVVDQSKKPVIVEPFGDRFNYCKNPCVITPIDPRIGLRAQALVAPKVPFFARRTILYYGMVTAVGDVKPRVEEYARNACPRNKKASVGVLSIRCGNVGSLLDSNATWFLPEQLSQMKGNGCMLVVVYSCVAGMRSCAPNTVVRTVGRNATAPGRKALSEAGRALNAISRHPVGSRAQKILSKCVVTPSPDTKPDQLSACIAQRADIPNLSTDVNMVRHDGLSAFCPALAARIQGSSICSGPYLTRHGVRSVKVYGGMISDGSAHNLAADGSIVDHAPGENVQEIPMVCGMYFHISDDGTLPAVLRAMGIGMTTACMTHTPIPEDVTPQGSQINMTSAASFSCDFPLEALAGFYLPPLSEQFSSFQATTRPLKELDVPGVAMSTRGKVLAAAHDLVSSHVHRLYEIVESIVTQQNHGLAGDELAEEVERNFCIALKAQRRRIVHTKEVASAVSLLEHKRTQLIDPNTIFRLDSVIFINAARKAHAAGRREAFLYYQTEGVLRAGFYTHCLCAHPFLVHSWLIMYALNYTRPVFFSMATTEPSPSFAEDVSLNLYETVELCAALFGQSGRAEEHFAHAVALSMQAAADYIGSRETPGAQRLTLVLPAENAPAPESEQ